MSEPARQMLPPHSTEAEQSVLGALMLDPALYDDVRAIVGPDDFYRADHQMIFGAIGDMKSEGEVCDFVTLAEHLRNAGRLDEAGGITYLGSLATDTYSVTNARHYAEIVRERATLRRIIAVGGEAMQAGFRPEGRSAAEVMADVDRRLASIRVDVTRRSSDTVTVRTLVERVEAKVEAMRKNPQAVSGLATGYVDLDRRTTGLHPGDLVLVAGRPSMGKTSLAMCIAEHVAITQNLQVAIFTMEMPGEQLIQRALSSVGRVKLQSIRSGSLSDGEWSMLASASGLVRAAPIEIDETPALSSFELRARARRLHARAPLSLIVVDYVQLMSEPSARSRDENRTNEIAEISRNLKSLAKELGVPIIALSQLNRGVENRNNKRPRLSDLRESGSLEQDADLVLMVYRDEVYDADSKDRGIAEVLIEKQRNGPLGVVKLAFLGEFCKFDNLSDASFAGGGFD